MNLTKDDFRITTLEDELRVDGLCRDLLMTFYTENIERGIGEHEATLLANSADYYLRDYLIGARQLNLFEPETGVVRKFAGNWYIVNTLEPDSAELGSHLYGIREFYRFLYEKGVIGAGIFTVLETECADLDYYRQRIDSFWNIDGDGYFEWVKECSLK